MFWFKRSKKNLIKKIQNENKVYCDKCSEEMKFSWGKNLNQEELHRYDIMWLEQAIDELKFKCADVLLKDIVEDKERYIKNVNEQIEKYEKNIYELHEKINNLK